MEFLYSVLKATAYDKNLQGMILQSYIAENGPLSGEASEKVKEILEQKPVFYSVTLDDGTLIGRQDCEIRFIGYRGDISSLWQSAITRNITLTQITSGQYDYEVRQRLRQAKQQEIERERRLSGELGE